MEMNEQYNRAITYPYMQKSNSFIYYDDTTLNIDRKLLIEIGSEKAHINEFLRKQGYPNFSQKNYTPVLAIGSNGAPEQLARKFKDKENTIIPVIKAKLYDFDVVYSAHITSYGAAPATLQVSQGTKVDLKVTYLTNELLEIMNKTESVGVNYDLVNLKNVKVEFENGHVLSTVYCYISNHGCLTINNECIPLTATRADNRKYESMTTQDVLKKINQVHGEGLGFKHFIHKLIVDKDFRDSITDKMKKSNSTHFEFKNI
ncbi:MULTISPECIES: hypothetical protein [Bacillaceae]|uniref:Uncharacterized protein n=1 Tax=Evansella alkalicola TaxID=745819 RepID=A0ABS6JXF7_9BACI|nr:MULTISPECIES: hypothetical protein [Bacillaceae]MBU9723272.1 hypothetical protein [Bacillus alkalicola]